jgi:hypothetical protein
MRTKVVMVPSYKKAAALIGDGPALTHQPPLRRYSCGSM